LTPSTYKSPGFSDFLTGFEAQEKRSRHDTMITIKRDIAEL